MCAAVYCRHLTANPNWTVPMGIASTENLAFLSRLKYTVPNT